MTAGIDLALAMVDNDLGADVARAVARKLVVYHRRAGGQAKFFALLELEPKSDRIQSALAYAKRNLASPLTVEQLAEVAQAVLFRTSHHSGPLEVELTRRNIPFVKFGGLKFLDSAHVKDMLALLRFVQKTNMN
jgi:superfamily I DNA/RNA helicase